MKTALITGINGMDGSYLAEYLLGLGYTVHGMIRRASQFNTQRIEHLLDKLHLHYGDMTDSLRLGALVKKIEPDEVYNLAAQSHVKVSFDMPLYTAETDAMGVTRLLESIRQHNPDIRFYQASTSELFGGVVKHKQCEESRFYPRSPYAVAKLYGYWMTRNYREAYNMFACNGILYNHTSPRRGDTFVEKKIVRAAVRIALGLQECEVFGNIYSYRDIGHAKDYVQAMWLMLQQDQPDDYVICTGKSYKIKTIIKKVFQLVGIKLKWSGKNVDEIAVNEETGKVVIRIDPKYYRPSEVEYLQGDAGKAMSKLGWRPTYSLDDILREMVDEEFKSLAQAKV